mmetsp:Transcript_70991/g.169384  ORF Transcript_70991/g.169384 Transcript_70991/m.169384 type:complete len:81 (+) Transcript_70991:260-502(+)
MLCVAAQGRSPTKLMSRTGRGELGNVKRGLLFFLLRKCLVVHLSNLRKESSSSSSSVDASSSSSSADWSDRLEERRPFAS